MRNVYLDLTWKQAKLLLALIMSYECVYYQDALVIDVIKNKLMDQMRT